MRKVDKVDRAMKWAVIWSLVSMLVGSNTYLNNGILVYVITLCIKCVWRFGVFFALFWLCFALKEKISWWFSFHRPGGPRKIVDYNQRGEWLNVKDGDPPVD